MARAVRHCYCKGRHCYCTVHHCYCTGRHCYCTVRHCYCSSTCALSFNQTQRWYVWTKLLVACKSVKTESFEELQCFLLLSWSVSLLICWSFFGLQLFEANVAFAGAQISQAPLLLCHLQVLCEGETGSACKQSTHAHSRLHGARTTETWAGRVHADGVPGEDSRLRLLDGEMTFLNLMSAKHTSYKYKIIHTNYLFFIQNLTYMYCVQI